MKYFLILIIGFFLFNCGDPVKNATDEVMDIDSAAVEAVHESAEDPFVCCLSHSDAHCVPMKEFNETRKYGCEGENATEDTIK